MASIYCYGYNVPTLDLLGVVDDFISFNFCRSYSGIGEWQLVLDGSSLNAERVKGMDFISLGKDVAGLVLSYTDDVNEGQRTLTFTGVELKGITAKRIVIPESGEGYQAYYSRSPEYIIAQLLSKQVINPTDSTRQIYSTLEDYMESTTRIAYNGRYQDLSEEITALATAYNIGWVASIENAQIVWKIYHGIDRTAGQTANNRMMLDYEYGTMNNSTLTVEDNIPNYVLVGGQGEGANRSIATINQEKENIARIETFLDARDVADDALLSQRGEEKLAEYGDNTSYTASLSPQAMKQYRNDFDLGDIGTIRDTKINGSLNYRITTIEEVYEENIQQVNITFGYALNELKDAIKRMNSKRDSLLAVEGSGTQSGEGSGDSGESGGSGSGSSCDCGALILTADESGNVTLSGESKIIIDGGGGGSGSASIHIGTDAPTDGSNVWIDTDEPIPSIPSGGGSIDNATIVDLIYPIGSIYMSMNAANPTNLFGGSWEQLQDTFLLGAGSSYAAGSTGGEATHKLTTNEMPNHSHDVVWYGSTPVTVSVSEGNIDVLDLSYSWQTSAGGNVSAKAVGGNQAHNNMPPYLAVYMWKRTA